MNASSSEVKIKFKTPASENYFAGYYDKPALNSSNEKLLVMKVDFFDRLPEATDIAEIGYFDINTSLYHKLTSTNCFNWQQGAMLQWVGPDFNSRIAFNRRTDSGFRGILYEIETGRSTELCAPIYSINPSGTMALAIDFERHYWCRRGYSYAGIRNETKQAKVVRNDGISLVDFKSNSSKLLVTVEELMRKRPLKSMNGATHYLEHMMFSPTGDKFSFYHRWKPENGGLYTRLYVADCDGMNMNLIHDTGRMSHHNWLNNNEIVAIGSEKTSLASSIRKYSTLSLIAKPLLPLYKKLIKGNTVDGQTKTSSILTGDSYFTLNVISKKSKPVFKSSLSRDGHPSRIPGKLGYIVTDTYPNAQSEAQLIVAHLPTETAVTVDSLKSIGIYDNTPMRCDLHPKISLDGRFVSIDTMNDGVRGIYVYEISKLN